jgi:hypothetical protein
MYWVDIAASPDEKLKAVDGLLRRVWLECCGHLSELSPGPSHRVAMTRRIDEVLGESGSRLDYAYDFGSGTELVMSHIGVVASAPEKSVRMVGRNEAPAWPGDECVSGLRAATGYAVKAKSCSRNRRTAAAQVAAS